MNMKEQRIYGGILVVCGVVATLALSEISGAGLLLILMGVARIFCKD